MGRRNKSGYETDTRRLTIFVINWIAHWLTSSTCSHTCFNTQTTRNVLDLDVTQTLMGTVWCKLISVARNSWPWSQTCRHNGMCWIIDSLTPHTHTHTHTQFGPAHVIWAWQEKDPPNDHIISYHSMRGSATVTMVTDNVNAMETTMFPLYTKKHTYICYQLN